MHIVESKVIENVLFGVAYDVPALLALLILLLTATLYYRRQGMIRQTVSFLLRKQPHRSIEIIAAREV
jgi:hypothetical protein